MPTPAFLLSRTSRESERGIELEFWAWTASGPLRLVVPRVRAVAHIERDHEPDLPDGVSRNRSRYALLGNAPADMLRAPTRTPFEMLEAAGTTLRESDLDPADRWLVARGIRAGMVLTIEDRASAPEADDPEREAATVRSGQPTPSLVRTMTNPVASAADVRPTLSLLSLDLEMRAGTNALYSIAGAALGGEPWLLDHRPELAERGVPAAAVFMLGEGTTERREGYTLYWARDERHLLGRFFGWLALIDPDVLSGWSVIGFDLRFLETKCRELGLPFAIGRGRRVARLREPPYRGAPPRADVPGRVALDGGELMRSFDRRPRPSYSLEAVSRDLLGRGKVIGPDADKVGEINRLFHEDRAGLADYNLVDCTLVNDIIERVGLLDLAVARTALGGLTLERAAEIGGPARNAEANARLFDAVYLPALHAHRRVGGNRGGGSVGERSPAAVAPYERTAPGLYDDVAVIDIDQLRVAVTETWRIDPLARAEPGDDALRGVDGQPFARDRHVLPTELAALRAVRESRGGAMARAATDVGSALLDALGARTCRLGDPSLAANLAARVDEVIAGSCDWFEREGYRVVHADADALFVTDDRSHPGGAARDVDERTLPPSIARRLTEHWCDRLREEAGVDSAIRFVPRTRFRRLLVAPARAGTGGCWAGLPGRACSPSAKPALVVHGFQRRREDWTPLARRVQRELLACLLAGGDHGALVRAARGALLAGDCDDELVYTRRLRGHDSAHPTRAPLHVRAARKLARPGRHIRYLVTLAGPEPLACLSAPPDYAHYIERQLVPAVDAALAPIGASWSRVVDSQLDLF